MKRHTYKEIAQTARKAAKSLLAGFISLLWAVLLLVAETAVRAYEKAVSAIRAYPCVSTVATFIVMLAVAIAVHAQMKVQLTTVEWQRDSLVQRLDSAKMTYYRYQSYKE